MNIPIIYLDKCCGSATWLKKEFSNAYILLDNLHLITRNRDNSKGNDKIRQVLFMKEISKIIIGMPRAPMRVGGSIFEELSTFIIKFTETKSYFPSSTNVISSALKQCYKAQKKYFTNF